MKKNKSLLFLNLVKKNKQSSFEKGISQKSSCFSINMIEEANINNIMYYFKK